MAFPVFFDTCTLFGQVLTDLLLRLAKEGCFAPQWSREVLDAMERNVVARHRATADAIGRRRELMERAFPEAMVDGFEALIDTMTNDPADRHVLAACVVSPAQTIVTFNLKDFPPASVVPYDIDVLHPDDFILDQLDLHPIWSRLAIESMLRMNRQPPQEINQLATSLTGLGLPKSAQVIRHLFS